MCGPRERPGSGQSCREGPAFGPVPPPCRVFHHLLPDLPGSPREGRGRSEGGRGVEEEGEAMAEGRTFSGKEAGCLPGS